MCCRTSVTPLDKTIARILLQIGMFTPAYGQDPEQADVWQRVIAEEDCTVYVHINSGSFEASISPSISSMDHHHGKRITGGVYFEICAKYAEKVGGEITQKATVAGCTNPGEPQAHVLAHYPEMPMLWENVCNGFQDVLLGGHDEEIAV